MKRLCLSLLWASQAWTAHSVTLAWDIPPDPAIAGYKIYYGVASRVYTNNVNAGAVMNYSVLNLKRGQQYYFAVTSYYTNGLESDYSNEVSAIAVGTIGLQTSLKASGPWFTITSVPSVTFVPDTFKVSINRVPLIQTRMQGQLLIDYRWTIDSTPRFWRAVFQEP